MLEGTPSWHHCPGINLLLLSLKETSLRPKKRKKFQVKMSAEGFAFSETLVMHTETEYRMRPFLPADAGPPLQAWLQPPPSLSLIFFPWQNRAATSSSVRPRVSWAASCRSLQGGPGTPAVVVALVGPWGFRTANSRPGSGPQGAHSC